MRNKAGAPLRQCWALCRSEEYVKKLEEVGLNGSKRNLVGGDWNHGIL